MEMRTKSRNIGTCVETRKFCAKAVFLGLELLYYRNIFLFRVDIELVQRVWIIL